MGLLKKMADLGGSLTGNLDAGHWAEWAPARGWTPIHLGTDGLQVTAHARMNNFTSEEEVVGAWQGTLACGLHGRIVAFKARYGSSGLSSEGSHFRVYTNLQAYIPEGALWDNGFVAITERRTGEFRVGHDPLAPIIRYRSVFLLRNAFDTAELEPFRSSKLMAADKHRPNSDPVLTLEGPSLTLAINNRPKGDEEADEWIRLFDLAAAQARRAIIACQSAANARAEVVPIQWVVDDAEWEERVDYGQLLAAHRFAQPPSIPETRVLRDVLRDQTRAAFAHRARSYAFAHHYAGSRGMTQGDEPAMSERLGMYGANQKGPVISGTLPGGHDVTGHIVVGFDNPPEVMAEIENELCGEDTVIVPLDEHQQQVLSQHLPRGDGSPGTTTDYLTLGCLVVKRWSREAGRTPEALDGLAEYAAGLAAWAKTA